MGLWVAIGLLAGGVTAEPAGTGAFGELYTRIAEATQRGEPLGVTVYVALCDVNSQGVVAGKHAHRCQGDVERNLYWSVAGGLQHHLDRSGWTRSSYQKVATGPVAARGVWRRTLATGNPLAALGAPEWIEVELTGIAYRGPAIRRATADYFAALDDEGPHLVGYVGHNVLLDVDDASALRSGAQPTDTPKGAFALACLSDEYFRPALNRAGASVLLLNTTLTYPNARTLLALVEGVVAGDGPEALRRRAARAHGLVQRKAVTVTLPMFVNGPGR